jgi:hypothetical protein
VTRTFTLELGDEQVTAEELIRRYVYEFVTERNARQVAAAAGGALPDWERETLLALDAFANHGFLLFLDDRQLDDSDEVCTLQAGSRVVFLRLQPLVGG